MKVLKGQLRAFRSHICFHISTLLFCSHALSMFRQCVFMPDVLTNGADIFVRLLYELFLHAMERLMGDKGATRL